VFLPRRSLRKLQGNEGKRKGWQPRPSRRRKFFWEVEKKVGVGEVTISTAVIFKGKGKGFVVLGKGKKKTFFFLLTAKGEKKKSLWCILCGRGGRKRGGSVATSCALGKKERRTLRFFLEGKKKRGKNHGTSRRKRGRRHNGFVPTGGVACRRLLGGKRGAVVLQHTQERRVLSSLPRRRKEGYAIFTRDVVGKGDRGLMMLFTKGKGEPER